MASVFIWLWPNYPQTSAGSLGYLDSVPLIVLCFLCTLFSLTHLTTAGVASVDEATAGLSGDPGPWALRGRLKRSARAVQLFGLLTVVETHFLWYFGHHCCLVVGFDALGMWHFWTFTLFHPFLLFCTHFPPISTLSTLFLG